MSCRCRYTEVRHSQAQTFGFELERVRTELLRQLPFNFDGNRHPFPVPGPRSPLKNLGAAKTGYGERFRRVKDNAVFARPVQNLPERWRAILSRPNVLRLLLTRPGLIGVIHPMFTRQGPGKNGGPARCMQGVGGCFQLSRRPFSQQRSERGKNAFDTPLFDQREVAHVKPDNENPIRHVSILCFYLTTMRSAFRIPANIAWQFSPSSPSPLL